MDNRISDRALHPLNGPTAKAVRELASGYINLQSGSSYTLQASDWGLDVEMSNAGANTVTVEAALPDGFWCNVVQVGGGQTTIAAGSGATILTYSSEMKLAGQGADCLVRRRVAAGAFRISGNLVP